MRAWAAALCLDTLGDTLCTREEAVAQFGACLQAARVYPVYRPPGVECRVIYGNYPVFYPCQKWQIGYNYCIGGVYKPNSTKPAGGTENQPPKISKTAQDEKTKHGATTNGQQHHPRQEPG